MCSRTPPKSFKLGAKNQLEHDGKKTNTEEGSESDVEDMFPLDICKENMEFLDEVLIVGQKLTQNNVVELKIIS